jgi:hypothetical protein
MVATVKSSISLSRREHLDLIRPMYHKRLPLLLRRYKRGKSLRALSKVLNLSHPTVLAILNHPNRSVSLKTMMKVLRATSRRRNGSTMAIIAGTKATCPF